MDESVLTAAVGKASRRFVWFLMLLYFFAVLDRVNVGVAGVAMRSDLHLSAADFGFAAGIFFLGYMVFEIPSNLLLARFGARVWIARIVITWGLAAMAVALASNAASLAGLRFLLGVAEAGFFPGVIFYLMLWFPSRHRARINAIFLLGVPLSNAIAAAISSPILALNGTLGLAGWQWLFVLEGGPPVLLGLAALALLADRPADVGWLDANEKRAIATALAAEHPPGSQTVSVRAALLSPAMWLFSLAYFGVSASLATLGMWLPQVVHGLGSFSVIESGLISSAILLPGALAMFLWSRHSDVAGERVRHLIAAALCGCMGWVLAATVSGTALSIAALTIASAGTYATLSVFWTLPIQRLSGRAAAAGIALIGSVGNLGGFVGPWAIGQIKDATGGFAGGFVLVAVALLITAGVALRSGHGAPATAAVA